MEAEVRQFIHTWGLGSSDLFSAPLAAEIVAAQIFGETLPVNRTVAQTLNPNRFWIRNLLKKKEIVQQQPFLTTRRGLISG
ncbi:hypothetical protein [Sodalis sp.]|uniref:hypothetical protein n=1 Tax=Sodalis sp. (in: enterobacteria) TaxID=1898979 RepID=UPI0038738C9B